MSPQSLYIIMVLTLVGVVQASIKPDDVLNKNEDCEQPRLPSFNETFVVGTWHPQQNKSSDTDAPVGAECVHLTSVGDQERRDLKDMIGTYVDKLKWENLSLRMQLPCLSAENNTTNDIYLERLNGDGCYKMLSMPPSPVKLEFGAFARYPIRMKIVDNQYLGMMSCQTYLFGKQQAFNTTASEQILDNIQLYWPEDV